MVVCIASCARKATPLLEVVGRQFGDNAEMVRQFPPLVDVADHTEGTDLPILAECNVVSASASLEGKFRRSDTHTRREGFLKCQSEFRTCAVAWPYGLIEVSHNYQAPCGRHSENFREAGQVTSRGPPTAPCVPTCV